MGISILYLFAIITPTTINNHPITCSNTGIWSKNINDAIGLLKTSSKILKKERCARGFLLKYKLFF